MDVFKGGRGLGDRALRQQKRMTFGEEGREGMVAGAIYKFIGFYKFMGIYKYSFCRTRKLRNSNCDCAIYKLVFEFIKVRTVEKVLGFWTFEDL